MKSMFRNSKSVLCQALCIVLLGSLGYAATTPQKFDFLKQRINYSTLNFVEAVS